MPAERASLPELADVDDLVAARVVYSHAVSRVTALIEDRLLHACHVHLPRLPWRLTAYNRNKEPDDRLYALGFRLCTPWTEALGPLRRVLAEHTGPISLPWGTLAPDSARERLLTVEIACSTKVVGVLSALRGAGASVEVAPDLTRSLDMIAQALTNRAHTLLADAAVVRRLGEPLAPVEPTDPPQGPNPQTLDGIEAIRAEMFRDFILKTEKP